ncbi:MAG: hypothetical protein ACPHLK_03200 [Gammaproteobacteria bacterium]
MGSTLKLIIRKLTKGLFLIGWIWLLSIVALYAASNSVSKQVFELFEYNTVFYYFNYFDQEEIDPGRELTRYLSRYRENPPPIESVIEMFLSRPHWTQINLESEGNISNHVYWKRHQYRRLFEKAHQKLTLIALDDTVNVKDAKINFEEVVPSTFIKLPFAAAGSFTIPPIAANWVMAERPRLKLRKARSQLIDTFVLLMVLGAFGSLIFLTRDYIVYEEASSLETYIFRPILGMFLAISMFIIDIAAHTVLSQSHIFEIRKETLYLLAFAAGLLSEQAYSLVEGKASKALAKVQEQQQSQQPTVTNNTDDSNVKKSDG